MIPVVRDCTLSAKYAVCLLTIEEIHELRVIQSGTHNLRFPSFDYFSPDLPLQSLLQSTGLNQRFSFPNLEQSKRVGLWGTLPADLSALESELGEHLKRYPNCEIVWFLNKQWGIDCISSPCVWVSSTFSHAAIFLRYSSSPWTFFSSTSRTWYSRSATAWAVESYQSNKRIFQYDWLPL